MSLLCLYIYPKGFTRERDKNDTSQTHTDTHIIIENVCFFSRASGRFATQEGTRFRRRRFVRFRSSPLSVSGGRWDFSSFLFVVPFKSRVFIVIIFRRPRRLLAGSREIISFLVFEILSVCRRRAFGDATTTRRSFRSPALKLEKEHPPRVFNSFFLTSSSSSSPKTDSPKRVFSNQVQSIKRTRKSSIKCSSASSSSTTTSEEDNTDFSRRQAVLSTAAGAFALTQNVNPSYALSGFNVVKETRDGYQFIYPVGWQEISVDGQAKVFKDIIEPLESISLNIYPTERESLKDIGTAQEVAETLVKQALSAPGALGKLLSAKERTDKDGHLYYSFEFVSKTKSYERHALTTVTITQGKFFTLTTGSSERRWDKMKERLNAANDSFQVYY